MLSRVAESIHWMGRYIERAENVARFIDVNLNLMLDLPVGSAQQWQPLIDITGDTNRFARRYGAATQQNVIQFLTFDPENVNSICSCLRAARENARSVREVISSEMWEQLNQFYLMVNSAAAGRVTDPQELFASVKLSSHLFAGITDATMTHNEGWHFCRLGRDLERADKTSRILDVKYFMLLPSIRDVGTPYDDIHWSAVLKSVSGFEMYRKKYGRITPADVVDFLVMDNEFPRAVRFCIKSASESLQAVTGTPIGAFRYRSEQLMGQLRAELDFTSVDTVLRNGLHEYLDRLQLKMNGIDEGLRDDFAVRTTPPVASQSQSQSQGSGAGPTT